MKKAIIAAAITAITATAPITATAATPAASDLVYVWDQSGEVNIYDSIPAVSLPDRYHVEVMTGTALDSTGAGQVLTSSDGPIDSGYDYISYSCTPVEAGDTVTTVVVYSCDIFGDWEDDIIYRFDMITERASR